MAWFEKKLIDVASKVCGYTKGKPRYFETWWWNKDLVVAVCRKTELLRIWKQSRNEKVRKKYCEAKKDSKKVVYMAIEQKGREPVEKVDSCRDGREFFKIAKKRLGRREILSGLVILKMTVGQ